mgnify:CR=1 FL=1
MFRSLRRQRDANAAWHAAATLAAAAGGTGGGGGASASFIMGTLGGGGASLYYTGGGGGGDVASLTAKVSASQFDLGLASTSASLAGSAGFAGGGGGGGAAAATPPPASFAASGAAGPGGKAGAVAAVPYTWSLSGGGGGGAGGGDDGRPLPAAAAAAVDPAVGLAAVEDENFLTDSLTFLDDEMDEHVCMLPLVQLIEKYSDPGSWDAAKEAAAAAAARAALFPAASAGGGSSTSGGSSTGGDAPMPSWLQTLFEALNSDHTPRCVHDRRRQHRHSWVPLHPTRGALRVSLPPRSATRTHARKCTNTHAHARCFGRLNKSEHNSSHNTKHKTPHLAHATQVHAAVPAQGRAACGVPPPAGAHRGHTPPLPGAGCSGCSSRRGPGQ